MADPGVEDVALELDAAALELLRASATSGTRSAMYAVCGSVNSLANLVRSIR